MAPALNAWTCRMNFCLAVCAHGHISLSPAANHILFASSSSLLGREGCFYILGAPQRIQMWAGKHCLSGMEQYHRHIFVVYTFCTCRLTLTSSTKLEWAYLESRASAANLQKEWEKSMSVSFRQRRAKLKRGLHSAKVVPFPCNFRGGFVLWLFGN